MSEDDNWKCTKAEIHADGSAIEITFKHRNGTSQQTVTKTAASWMAGSWANFKLAEFESALREAIDILQGRK